MKLKSITILSCLALASCATWSEFTASPDTTTAINDLINGAQSYISGNNVGAAVSGVEGAAALLRAIQGTPKAAVPGSVQMATISGGASPIAPLVANAVKAEVVSGKTPDAANETVAKVLDAVVAKNNP